MSLNMNTTVPQPQLLALSVEPYHYDNKYNDTVLDGPFQDAMKLKQSPWRTIKNKDLDNLSMLTPDKEKVRDK